jgi:signal transduction histidine kinase
MDEFSIESFREQLFKFSPDEFFHVMAHDLRSPLANILGALSLLKDHPNHALSDDEYATCMRIIEEGVQRLDQMIDSALEYGRIQYQKCKPATESPA